MYLTKLKLKTLLLLRSISGLIPTFPSLLEGPRSKNCKTTLPGAQKCDEVKCKQAQLRGRTREGGCCCVVGCSGVLCQGYYERERE